MQMDSNRNMEIGKEMEEQSDKAPLWWHAGTKGFYDYPIDNGVEIGYEYWQHLLSGQSAGAQIETNGDDYPVLGQRVPTVDEARERKLNELRCYDRGEHINSFTVNGMNVWLDKATRVGLSNIINVEESLGRETIRLWLGKPPVAFETAIGSAKDMLAAVEIYAKECYDNTKKHEIAISLLRSEQEITTYDFTEGYPPKVSFEL